MDLNSHLEYGISFYTTSSSRKDFTRTEADHIIFVSLSLGLILGVYVDDMLVVGNTQNEIDKVKRDLTGEFKMSDLESVSWYLEIKITCDISSAKMFLSQASYVEKILERFGIQQANGVDTPMVKQNALVHDDKGYQADNSTITWYQQAVGSLMYAMTEMRFDIAYTMSTVSQFASNPTTQYVAEVKQIFRYLRKYPSLEITFSQDKAFELKGHVDSDWAMDPNTRRSTTGYLFRFARGVVSVSSKRQQSVTLSSTEGEYVAYCQATMEAVWLWLLLKELEQPRLKQTTLHFDNKSAILLANNPEFHSQTKHIDTKVHWICEIVKRGIVILKWTPGTEQIADRLTKSLEKIPFQAFVTQAGMTQLERGSVLKFKSQGREDK